MLFFLCKLLFVACIFFILLRVINKKMTEGRNLTSDEAREMQLKSVKSRAERKNATAAFFAKFQREQVQKADFDVCDKTLLNMTMEELATVVKDGNLPAFVRIRAKQILDKDEGFNAVEKLADRQFGKPKQINENINSDFALSDYEAKKVKYFSDWNTAPKVYRRFFNATEDERNVFLQGGRRSAKTYSTFLWLRFIGYLNGTTETPVTIMVVCFQHPQLQKTIKDFEQVTGVMTVGSEKEGRVADTIGAHWMFQFFDSKEKAQGTQCDYLFINEAVNVSEDVADVLKMGCRRQVFYNFNPTKKFWGNKDFNSVNLLCTKWSDNEYLTEQQREEFEKIKERAMKPNARKWDIYQYKVYYLGEFADLVGNVFGEIGKCGADEYFALPSDETIGLDFGFATDGDPTAVVGVKLHEGRIYCHQYIYERGLTSDAELDRKLNECGINKHVTIHSDYGGNGRGRMDNLIRNYGRKMVNAIKGSVFDGIGTMLTFDGGIVVTRCSDAMIDEYENYELDDAGRSHGDDHAIDACRYAFNYSLRKSKTTKQ